MIRRLRNESEDEMYSSFMSEGDSMIFKGMLSMLCVRHERQRQGCQETKRRHKRKNCRFLIFLIFLPKTVEKEIRHREPRHCNKLVAANINENTFATDDGGTLLSPAAHTHTPQ
jgi:hypothetical protein